MGEGHVTIHGDGGWTVELTKPLVRSSGEKIATISLQQPELAQVIRWGQGLIPSTLAMIAELSGVPEQLLRTLKYPDVDRVLLAYCQVVPEVIRKDFEAGVRPISTPEDELPPTDDVTSVTPADPVDPRFPKVEGIVERYRPPPEDKPPSTPLKPVPSDDDDDGGSISADPPNVARRVG